MLALYRRGSRLGGWICHTCEREFPHDGRPFWAYLRLLAHKARARHPMLCTCPSCPVKTTVAGRTFYVTLKGIALNAEGEA